MRTKEGEARYKEYKAQGGLDHGCRLCEALALRTFTHWKIVKNKFPYDLIAEIHDMLVPLLHHSVNEVTSEAWQELHKIRQDPVGKEYDFMIEVTKRRLSIPAHFHLHLIVFKKQSKLYTC